MWLFYLKTQYQRKFNGMEQRSPEKTTSMRAEKFAFVFSEATSPESKRYKRLVNLALLLFYLDLLVLMFVN